MKSFFLQLKKEIEKGNDTEIVVITDMSGSAPRGVGAMMLVDKDGLVFGTIGGGPAENQSIEMAKEHISLKKSSTYDFRLYENNISDIGAVCGGDIAIFLQFVDSSDNRWIDFIDGAILKIDKRIPDTICFDLKGDISKLLNKQSRQYEYSEDKFNLPLIIHERAFVFGAGHCSKALVPILSSVGFSVTVMDDRKELLKEDNFPTAENLVIDNYNKAGEILDIGNEDYVVIMTAGHKADYILEEQLIRKNPAYIGVIGSRSKIGVVNEKLRNDGITEEQIKTVHTPIGLDIHSVTPEEVAVSIAAEMIYERHEFRIKNGLNIEKKCPV